MSAIEGSLTRSFLHSLWLYWQVSQTRKACKSFSHFLVNTFFSSWVGLILKSYRYPDTSQATWGKTFRKRSRHFLQNLAQRFIFYSKFTGLINALSQGFRSSPFTLISEILLGFTTIYFSLGFQSGKFSGLSIAIIASGLFTLGLIGTLLPPHFLKGSLLGRFLGSSRESHRELISPLILGASLGLFSFLSSPLLVLGLCTVLVFVVFGLRDPEIALYALAAYAPLDTLIRSNLPSTLSRLWPFLLLFFLFLSIFFYLIQEERRKFHLSEVAIPLLFFLLWNVLSMVSSSASFSVNFEGIRAILFTSLFFFASLNALHSRKGLNRILIFLAIVVIAISLFAIYQRIIEVPVKPGWVDVDFEKNIKTRAYSIFPSPNALSGYIILVLPLFLTLFLEERSASKKILYLATTGLATLALLLTLTRAGWLVCAVTLLLLGIIHDKRILLLLLVVAILLPFIPEIGLRLETMLTGEYWVKTATAGRLYRWKLGLNIAQGNPLFGSGPGTFGGAVAYRAGYWPGIYADNYYIKTAAELGFGGLALFLILLLFVIIGGLKRLRALKGSLSSAAWGISFGLLAFLMHNFTENLWEEPPLTVTFWFLAGLLYALPYLEKEDAAKI